MCANYWVCLLFCSIDLFFCWVCLFFRCLTFKRGLSSFSVVGNEGCEELLCGFFCLSVCLFFAYFVFCIFLTIQNLTHFRRAPSPFSMVGDGGWEEQLCGNPNISCNFGFLRTPPFRTMVYILHCTMGKVQHCTLGDNVQYGQSTTLRARHLTWHRG